MFQDCLDICYNLLMKKIIALSCSPSRGRNSDSMLDAFIEGVRKNPLVEIEKIYLDDIHIEHYNHKNSLGPLPHETEFAKLSTQIQSANGLIIATPTYNFSVPAHLKNFIDRSRFFALDMEHKNALGQPKGKLGYLGTYFLISGGTPVWAQRILFFTFPAFWLRGVFLYFGAQVFGAYYSGDTQTFQNKKILAKCKKQGIRFAEQIVREEKHGILERIFWRPPQV